MVRRRSVPLAALLLPVSLSSARPSLAYCRTTTVRVPAGYDPTLTGCIDAGEALAWPSMPVTYALEAEASSKVSSSSFATRRGLTMIPRTRWR